MKYTCPECHEELFADVEKGDTIECPLCRCSFQVVSPGVLQQMKTAIHFDDKTCLHIPRQQKQSSYLNCYCRRCGAMFSVPLARFGKLVSCPTCRKTLVAIDAEDSLEVFGPTPVRSPFSKQCSLSMRFIGRATRRDFWILTISIIGMAFGLGILGGLILSAVGAAHSSYVGILGIALLGMAFMMNIWWCSGCSRRLHDMGLSGMWVLLILTFGIIFQCMDGAASLLYYIVVMCVMGSIPGTVGDNCYGPDPQALSR